MKERERGAGQAKRGGRKGGGEVGERVVLTLNVGGDFVGCNVELSPGSSFALLCFALLCFELAAAKAGVERERKGL